MLQWLCLYRDRAAVTNEPFRETVISFLLLVLGIVCIFIVYLALFWGLSAHAAAYDQQDLSSAVKALDEASAEKAGPQVINGNVNDTVPGALVTGGC